MRRLGLGPLAVERGDQIAVRADRPVRLFPGRALRALGDVAVSSFSALKNSCHSASTEAGSVLVSGVEVFDVGGVAAVEERGAGKAGVGVLARHRDFAVGSGYASTHGRVRPRTSKYRYLAGYKTVVSQNQV